MLQLSFIEIVHNAKVKCVSVDVPAALLDMKQYNLHSVYGCWASKAAFSVDAPSAKFPRSTLVGLNGSPVCSRIKELTMMVGTNKGL